MPIVLGIDEVGYGPILGPLIVTGCVFSIPEEADFWLRLKESVGKQKKGLGNKLLVTDSKKAYSRGSGIKHLERTSLAFLNQMPVTPLSFSHLLSIVDQTANFQLKKYPWYPKTKEDLICKIDMEATGRLHKDMDKQGIELLDVICCYVDVAEFNRRVELTKNKADILIASIIQMIQRVVALASFFNEKHVIVVSDRIGGRMYYDKIIGALSNFALDSAELFTGRSSYKLTSDKQRVDIHFEIEADDKYFPVALSSMVGKYIREKVMQYMNEYFVKLQPGLKPTAGYYVDGLRFLRDLKDETLVSVSVARQDIIRIR
jgi:ribonuclease HII